MPPSIEMAAGSAFVIRKTLGEILAASAIRQPENLLTSHAHALLHANAEALYQVVM